MNKPVKPTEVQELMSKLEVARRRGADWIVSRIAKDGEPTGASENNYYYRVPWALALSGHVDVAARCLTWIERNALTASGDLQPGAPQKNGNGLGWKRDAASYPLAIIATGAWHLERYDVANKIMDTLVAFQDPKTGGGYIERPEFRDTGRMDLMNTAQLGMAALVASRSAMADAAFKWIERLIDDQPDMPNKLFLSTNKDGLVTKAPAGKEFGYVIVTGSPRQAFFNPGIAAAFMGRYHMVTGNKAAIEIGRTLLDFSERQSDAQFDHADTVHVGKFGWGAGSMLDVDPKDSHLKDALRMGQWYLDSQYPDGRWEPTKFLVPEPNDSDALWKTAEHIMLITIVLMALASRPRSRFGK